MLSYIIPTYNRPGALRHHINALRQQTYDDFEIIVVNDGDPIDRPSCDIYVETNHSGPAYARNVGADLANGDILLFVGDDCYPDRNLVAAHVAKHTAFDIAQGYTPWYFEGKIYRVLNQLGLQANWSALQEDGAWKYRAEAYFCLTTNYSIKKDLFWRYSGFNHEAFTAAAWEDIEFGFRLGRGGESMGIANNAINYHAHRYTLDTFMQRCTKEGYHRMSIAKLHPGYFWNLIEPEALRHANKTEASSVADDLHRAFNAVTVPGLEKPSLEFISYGMSIFSMLGVLERIKDENPAMKALLHVHTPEAVMSVVTGSASLDRGDISYAQHCAQWLMTDYPDNWACWSFAGEVELASGNKDMAIEYFSKSAVINNNNDWTRDRIKELN